MGRHWSAERGWGPRLRGGGSRRCDDGPTSTLHPCAATSIRGSRDWWPADFDAIILAMAGLKRLGKLDGLDFIELDEHDFVPSGGQGALALEARADGALGGAREIEAAVAALNDHRALAEVTAERAFLATIGASCVSPVGVKGSAGDDDVEAAARCSSARTDRKVSPMRSALPLSVGADLAEMTRTATAIGTTLGQRMIERGARELIERA